MTTNENQIKALFFSGAQCSICRALKPKLLELQGRLPQLDLEMLEASQYPEVAASHSVFSIPTLLILAEGKEYRRYHQSFSLITVENDLNRLVELMGD